jgi:predicted LPLAT superfamily acyltransferase
MTTSHPLRAARVPAWKRQVERGNLRVIRFMVWLSLLAGRPLSRMIVYGIAAYFFVFGGAARQASKDYLRRVLGRRPSAHHGFRHVLYFASVIHDRVYFLKGRFSLFDIKSYGREEFERDRDKGIPLLLMGAHVGSFEVLRAMGESQGFRISMLMYRENAAKLNATLAALDPDPAPIVIPLQRVDAMLTAQQHLAAGRVLGMLADRRLSHEPADSLRFLGSSAAFPRNPFRLAMILKCKVYFMVGLYLGGNRYAIHLAPLADFSQVASANDARVDRNVRIAAAQSAYVALLEKFTRMELFNWFNFFDFWNESKPFKSADE